MESGDESDDDLYPEDIRDRIQFHPNVNRREARYKMRYHIRPKQSGWKGALKLRETWVKVYIRCLRLL